MITANGIDEATICSKFSSWLSLSKGLDELGWPIIIQAHLMFEKVPRRPSLHYAPHAHAALQPSRSCRRLRHSPMSGHITLGVESALRLVAPLARTRSRCAQNQIHLMPDHATSLYPLTFNGMSIRMQLVIHGEISKTFQSLCASLPSRPTGQASPPQTTKKFHLVNAPRVTIQARLTRSPLNRKDSDATIRHNMLDRLNGPDPLTCPPRSLVLYIASKLPIKKAR